MEALIQELAEKYGPLLAVMLALILADLASGVGSAIKRGEFKWSVVGNFYRTNVVPQVFGWAITAFLSEVVARAQDMPDIANQILVLVGGYGFYAGAVLVLLISIGSNLRELSPTPAA